MKHGMKAFNRPAWLMAVVLLPGSVTAGAASSTSPATHAAAAFKQGVVNDRTLAGIYELAVSNDYTLAAAQATYRAGLEDRKLGLAELLPKVNAGFDYTRSHQESRGTFPAGGALFPNKTDTNFRIRNYSISLDQPVFDLPAWFRFRRGQDLSREAKAVLAQAQQDLIVRTAEAYVKVLHSVADLRASLSEQAAFKAQLEQAQQRFDVGLVAITDVHEAQAAYDLAVATRLTDKGALGIALEQLSVLTGQEHTHLWQLRDDYPVVAPDPADSEQWVKFALANNYDIKVANLRRQVARQEARAARAKHLPSISLSMSYQDRENTLDQENKVQGIDNKFPSDSTTASMLLSAKLPLFAGGAISAGRRQAAARLSSATEKYQGTLRQVIQQTRALYIQVVSETAQTRARRQAVTSTRSALDAAQAGYEVGTRDIVDVLNAQRLYFSAIRDYANERLNYVLDKFRLQRQAGTVSPESIYALNAWLEAPTPIEASAHE